MSHCVDEIKRVIYNGARLITDNNVSDGEYVG